MFYMLIRININVFLNLPGIETCQLNLLSFAHQCTSQEIHYTCRQRVVCINLLKWGHASGVLVRAGVGPQGKPREEGQGSSVPPHCGQRQSQPTARGLCKICLQRKGRLHTITVRWQQPLKYPPSRLSSGFYASNNLLTVLCLSRYFCLKGKNMLLLANISLLANYIFHQNLIKLAFSHC